MFYNIHWWLVKILFCLSNIWKSEAFNILFMYKDFVKKKTNNFFQILKCDQGGEYKFKNSLIFAKKRV